MDLSFKWHKILKEDITLMNHPIKSLDKVIEVFSLNMWKSDLGKNNFLTKMTWTLWWIKCDCKFSHWGMEFFSISLKVVKGYFSPIELWLLWPIEHSGNENLVPAHWQFLSRPWYQMKVCVPNFVKPMKPNNPKQWSL